MNVQVRQSGGARVYYLDRVPYVSVTTALSIIDKPHLNEWRARVGLEEAERVRKEAAELGTHIHGLVEQVHRRVQGLEFDEKTIEASWWLLDVTEGNRLEKMLDAYESWFDKNVVEVLHTEALVYSKKWRYAGRCDLVARLKGDSRPTVLDLKSSNAFDDQMGMQLSAYGEGLDEMYGIGAWRRMIVRVDKHDFSVHPREFWQGKADFMAFLHAVALWNHCRGKQIIHETSSGITNLLRNDPAISQEIVRKG